nr:MAG TPA: nucleocapsid protein [Bacteriophage sp.]
MYIALLGSNPSRATLSSNCVVFYIFGHRERN